MQIAFLDALLPFLTISKLISLTSEDFSSNFIDALYQILLTDQAAKWFIQVSNCKFLFQTVCHDRKNSYEWTILLFLVQERAYYSATKEFEHSFVNIKMQTAVQQHAEKKTIRLSYVPNNDMPMLKPLLKLTWLL